MGLRTNVETVEFSGVLEEDVESALKDAAKVSMGTEISEEDLNSIKDLADQVRFARPQCVYFCVFSKPHAALFR